MPLKLSTARADLQRSLLDARSVFGESTEQQQQFDQHLLAAVADFNRVAPLILTDKLTLQESVAIYPAPANAIRFHRTALTQDQNQIDPWDPRRLAVVPTPTITMQNGVRVWELSPTPTQKMLLQLETVDYPYSYFSGHVLDEDPAKTTILDAHLPQLVLRAQVEALRAIAVRNSFKPVAIRDASLSQTRNGTPAALAEQFMRMWEQQMRDAPDIYGTLRLNGGR